MRELQGIVTLAQVEAAVTWLAVLALPLGALGGYLVGRARGRLPADALGGLAVGLLGPVVWVMWLVYGAVVAHFGLDSVAGLFVNLGVFAVVGVGIGLLWASLSRRRLANRQPVTDNR